MKLASQSLKRFFPLADYNYAYTLGILKLPTLQVRRQHINARFYVCLLGDLFYSLAK
jgi:hypothetical protein